MDTNSRQQPIGYWLNRCDQAITAAINQRLANVGLSRVDRQVLNLIARHGSALKTYLYDQLTAMLPTSEQSGM